MRKTLSLAAFGATLTLTTLFSGCQTTGIQDRLNERVETVRATEQMAAEAFAMQIPAAAQQYQIQSGKPAEGFTDFVTADAIAPGSPYTLSITNLGRHGGCAVSPQTIDCPEAFTHVRATYVWQAGGQARADVAFKTP